MKRFIESACVAAVCLVITAAELQAVTTTFNRNVETDTENRPFFPSGYSDGVTTFLNPGGYSGTALPGVDNLSMVTGTGVGIGGDDGNGVPMGVGITFDVAFTVEVTGAGHTFGEGTEQGLAVNGGGSDLFPASLSTGEQVLFGNIQVNNLSISDPLGLLQPGATVGNLQWRALRGSTHGAGDAAVTSSDAAQTQDVTTFNTGASIGNDYIGAFLPLSAVYLTTTAGDWKLKGIQYQVDVNYDLAPPPATRRTFKFADPAATYDNTLTHQIIDNDTAVTITPVGNSGVLDTNANGVGVDSIDDGTSTTDMLAFQRRIDGSLPTPEAIHFSFDRDVSLESLTLGTLELDGTEGVVLSFVSGVNPFTGLTGYSGDYTLGATSLTFNSSAGGQTPYPITFGMNGQDAIEIEAGTVLALSSGPAFDGGFLLDMITVNVPATLPDADFDDDGVVDGDDLATWQVNFGSETGDPTTGDANGDGVVDGHDFLQWQQELNVPTPPASGVPEPTALALLLIAAAGWGATRRVKH